MSNRIPVAVLAATGTVGQRFVSLLENHPTFEVTVVTGSERRAGKRYGDAVNWLISEDIPESIADLTITPMTLKALAEHDVKLLFSALPSAPARELEPQLADAGYYLCTNASALRMAPDVPLLIPEINADHITLIDGQRAKRGNDGFAVASPNCSTSGIIFPLKALHDAFGITHVHAVTMQAISGAGHPGVSSLDILDNIIPYIGGEEEKVENETLKLLGLVDGDTIQYADIAVSAQTNRVPVVDGHLAALSIKLATPATQEEVEAVLRDFSTSDIVAGLPSSPEQIMILRDEPDRPQPRRDRDAGDGMSITVGRVQPCKVFDYKLISLVHNTLRGAASGSILNAELLVAEGYIKREEAEAVR